MCDHREGTCEPAASPTEFGFAPASVSVSASASSKTSSPAEPTLDQAVELLRAGTAIILPTDTVYGLSVAVAYAESPEILYDLKRRDHDKPIAWLVDGPAALRRYGDAVPEYVYCLADAFWPGPLTMIVSASSEVPAAFCAPGNTLALRMPDDELALELIQRLGCPLATTSANMSGAAAPRAFADIDLELKSQVELALQDDQVKSGIASTVIDCTGARPLLIREGAISLDDLDDVLRTL